jgi:hypothetical protein
LTPFLPSLSEVPKMVSKIETKKDKEERQSSQKVEKYTFPGERISIPLFLE